MENNEAVKTVAAELSTVDAPLYVFQPADVKEKFFLPEVVITAAAGIFVTAFLKGVNAELEKRGEELGKTITKWLIERIGGLFRRPGKRPQTEEDSLQKTKSAVKAASSKSTKEELDSALNKEEKRLSRILEDQGLLSKRAEKIARTVRREAEKLIRKK